jgi:hypothetical protein
MGRLIRAIFFTQPELLQGSQRSITFNDLAQFGSLDEAREFVVEQEVESVLRDSHIEQFKWLEKKLKIPLREGLETWPNFVELTERRNLFVHTDGQISSQYVNICQANNVSFEKRFQVGDIVGVDREYFQKSCETLFEIATKLTQVIWRKLIPDEIDQADRKLNFICYNLLKEAQYKLSKTLLHFALYTLRKHGSQRNKLIFIINLAIALKWGGEPEKAKEIIAETDWSACNLEFQLASSVLLEQFDVAADLMRKIGENGDVKKEHYKDWPVFKDFRHTPQFLSTYESIYGSLLEPVQPLSENDMLNEPDEYEKTLLLRELTDSWSFSQTHSVIAKLNKFSYFSKTQINQIVKAAIENTQISWIINDSDVKDFLSKAIKGREAEIDNENLIDLLEMLNTNK